MNPDGSDAAANRHVHKIHAPLERKVSDRNDAVGNGDACKACTIHKRPILDLRDGSPVVFPRDHDLEKNFWIQTQSDRIGAVLQFRKGKIGIVRRRDRASAAGADAVYIIMPRRRDGARLRLAAGADALLFPFFRARRGDSHRPFAEVMFVRLAGVAGLHGAARLVVRRRFVAGGKAHDASERKQQRQQYDPKFFHPSFLPYKFAGGGFFRSNEKSVPSTEDTPCIAVSPIVGTQFPFQ